MSLRPSEHSWPAPRPARGSAAGPTAVRELRRRLDTLEAAHVDQAIEPAGRGAQVAESLGVTKQAAHARDAAPHAARAGGLAVAGRARQAVARAEAEAARLGALRVETTTCCSGCCSTTRAGARGARRCGIDLRAVRRARSRRRRGRHGRPQTPTVSRARATCSSSRCARRSRAATRGSTSSTCSARVLHEPGGRGQRAVVASGRSPRAVERRLARALRGQRRLRSLLAVVLIEQDVGGDVGVERDRHVAADHDIASRSGSSSTSWRSSSSSERPSSGGSRPSVTGSDLGVVAHHEAIRARRRSSREIATSCPAARTPSGPRAGARRGLEQDRVLHLGVLIRQPGADRGVGADVGVAQHAPDPITAGRARSRARARPGSTITRPSTWEWTSSPSTAARSSRGSAGWPRACRRGGRCPSPSAHDVRRCRPVDERLDRVGDPRRAASVHRRAASWIVGRDRRRRARGRRGRGLLDQLMDATFGAELRDAEVSGRGRRWQDQCLGLVRGTCSPAWRSRGAGCRRGT